MARETKTIQLKRPFSGGTGPVTQVKVQEPTAGDFFMLGSPQTWVRAPGGQALVDNDAVIRAYAERLIVEPDPLLAMSQMSVLDAIAVKEAICDFFREPAATDQSE